MPNIPYPEFNDFHVKLASKIVQGSQPVEGHAFLSLNNAPNCIKDILIACRCCFRYKTEDGTTHTVLLFEEIQRNSTPFDDEGLPMGEYEFPFSFTPAESLPPSVNVAGGWNTMCNCRLWYEVRAYVMHAESHPTLDRKHLRTSVKFQRQAAYGPSCELAPRVERKKDYSFKHLELKAELDKDVYVHGEPIYVNVSVNNELLRNIRGVKLQVKQVITIRKRAMRQVKEFVIKHNVGSSEASGSGIPIKRNHVYTGRIAVTPVYLPEEEASVYGGVALAGTLDQREKPGLSPSITRTTPEGIQVQYFVNIILPVFMASDLVATIPFTLTDVMPSEENTLPPSYWVEENESIAQKRLEADENHDPYSVNAASASSSNASADPGADELPSYGDVLGSERPHASRSTVRMGMSRSVIQGSTDEFNSMSHNVDERGGTTIEPLDGIDEDEEGLNTASSILNDLGGEYTVPDSYEERSTSGVGDSTEDSTSEKV
eukprot:CFRG0185T1